MHKLKILIVTLLQSYNVTFVCKKLAKMVHNSKIICIFAAEGCENGLHLSIRKHSSAFGLHRPCPQILKQILLW